MRLLEQDSRVARLAVRGLQRGRRADVRRKPLGELWRVSPLGLLAHPVFSLVIVLALFCVTANVRWGVPWPVHFGVFVALEGALLAAGYFGSAARSRRWEKWRKQLPFALIEPPLEVLAQPEVSGIWAEPVFGGDAPTRAELATLLSGANVPGFRVVRLGASNAFAYHGPTLLMRSALRRLTERLLSTLHGQFPISALVVRPRFSAALRATTRQKIV